MSGYGKGSSFELGIIHYALQHGGILALRGAGSKCHSNDKTLKVDLMIIKNRNIYVIQAKHQKKHGGKDKRDFSSAVARHRLSGYYFMKSVYIEDPSQLKEVFNNGAFNE